MRRRRPARREPSRPQRANPKAELEPVLAELLTSALRDGSGRDKGVDELSARLAAEMVVLAFRVGFERWLRAGDREAFAPLALAALDDLRERMLRL